MFEMVIITPTSHRTERVVWLELETRQGNLVIQTGHAPLVASLKPYREIRFAPEQGDVQSLEFSGGIVEVQRNSVTIIADQ